MRRIILKLALTLLTFIVGVLSAYAMWLNRSPAPPRQAIHEADAPHPAAPQQTTVDAAAGEQGGIPIEEGWGRLTAAEFCFHGTNMYHPRTKDDPSAYSETGGPFRPDGWMPSLKGDERAGVEFLIRQIPDKSRTRAHVDPLGMALKGEVAVYCLQHIMGVNWYELKADYKTRLDQAVARDPGQHQAVLQRIVRSKRGSKEMMGLWARYYENLKQPSTSAN